MALLTFLIHVSGARASPCPETAGKFLWKINATIFILFSRLRGASILFISRSDHRAAFSKHVYFYLVYNAFILIFYYSQTF